MIKKIQKNLSKNMLNYTLLVIIGGLILGKIFPQLKSLSGLILYVIFIMIYPTMVNISLSHLKKVRGSTKPLITALVMNFVYAPLFIYALSSIFIHDPQIKLALMLLAIAPTSSMGLGYIGLAEGHMLSGAIIIAFAFIASIFIYPVAGSFFAGQAHLIIPVGMILKNLIWILVIPLVLGIITREYIEHKHEEGTFEKIKPYFSTVTLSALYLLIFIIFVSKAGLIIKNWREVFLIAPVVLIYYGFTIWLSLQVNKKIIKLDYGQHQSVAFTSISKNVAVTIAILVAVFGEKGVYMSTVPAIVALFQAPILMAYLHFKDHVKRYFLT